MVAVALFFLNRGYSAVNASPSWIAGTAWFASAAALLIALVWLWDHTNKRHWGVRLGLSLFVVFAIFVVGYNPIRDQYRRERASRVQQPSEIQSAPPSNSTTGIKIEDGSSFTVSKDGKVNISGVSQGVVVDKNSTIRLDGQINVKHTANAKVAPAAPQPAPGQIGNNNTSVNVPNPPAMGNGNTIIGPTDSNGNTIYNRGGTAIGAGATADPTSIAIGAGAHAGGNVATPAGRCTRSVQH
jgi:hypothetical protein